MEIWLLVLGAPSPKTSLTRCTSSRSSHTDISGFFGHPSTSTRSFGAGGRLSWPKRLAVNEKCDPKGLPPTHTSHPQPSAFTFVCLFPLSPASQMRADCMLINSALAAVPADGGKQLEAQRGSFASAPGLAPQPHFSSPGWGLRWAQEMRVMG